LRSKARQGAGNRHHSRSHQTCRRPRLTIQALARRLRRQIRLEAKRRPLRARRSKGRSCPEGKCRLRRPSEVIRMDEDEENSERLAQTRPKATLTEILIASLL